MALNDNLHRALKNKNDEFYTLYDDVKIECDNYIEFFRDKIIYLNADDENSAFWQYFYTNFETFGLKQLYATHLQEPKSYILSTQDGKTIKKIELKENGDCFSTECRICIKLADIIITNPPFSLFKDWVSLLESYNKQWLLVGNENSCTATEIFPLMRDKKVQTGFNKIRAFRTPNQTLQNFGNIGWFTNLPVNKNIPQLSLTCSYSTDKYPEYDNYQAINVPRVNQIPNDYFGIMGVPIGFLTNKWNYDQFEVLGMAAGNAKNNNLYGSVPYVPHNEDRGGAALLNGERQYSRIFIRRK